jgi:hypothetical protein
MSTGIARRMNRRRIEYERQEKEKLGWSILYDMADKLRRIKGRIKENSVVMLENSENELKQHMHSQGVKNHKGMLLFRQQAAYMIKKGYIESGIDHLLITATQKSKR